MDLELLAFEFFKKFSRMEYVLKRMGLLQNGSKAKADWNQLELRISYSFPNNYSEVLTADLQLTINYLLNNPPNTLYKRNRTIEWDLSEIDSTLSVSKRLINILNITRNNLFHGGKSTDILENTNYERNQLLLESCIKIIDYILSQDSEIRTTFG